MGGRFRGGWTRIESVRRSAPAIAAVSRAFASSGIANSKPSVAVVTHARAIRAPLSAGIAPVIAYWDSREGNVVSDIASWMCPRAASELGSANTLRFDLLPDFFSA